MSPATLLSVMYAPLTYVHQDHRMIADIDLLRLPPEMANQLLLHHHGLANEIDFDLRSDAEAKQCLDHWTYLPRVCYLMGVHCLRAALLERACYLSLDPISKRFLCLPLRAVPRVRPTDKLDDLTIVATGVGVIAQVLQRLSLPLRQRLPLLFPRAVCAHLDTLLGEARSPQGSEYPSLFSFAMNYALLDTPTVT